MNDQKTSIKMSYILRHDESSFRFMDSEGFIDVDIILQMLNVSMYDLDKIVHEDKKQRYSYTSKKDKIRANQGHSLPVSISFKSLDTALKLYHGTTVNSMSCISHEGIKAQSRQYVHLTSIRSVAENVARRHGRQISICEIQVDKMMEDGYDFYISDNGVYLTKCVPSKYIRILEGLYE